MRLAVVVLFLAGCSASTVYGDGVPMRAPVVEPRPGYAPAGIGLPEYWGRSEPEPLPRSPHKRLLPPEKGPGIWAGDEPKAVVGPVTVLGENLPQPEYETPEAREPMKRCAEFFLGGILSEHGLGLEVYRAPPKLRRCALLDVLKACLDTSDGGRTILRHMTQMMKAECSPPPGGTNELAAKIESASIRAADGKLGGGTPQ